MSNIPLCISTTISFSDFIHYFFSMISEIGITLSKSENIFLNSFDKYFQFYLKNVLNNLFQQYKGLFFCSLNKTD